MAADTANILGSTASGAGAGAAFGPWGALIGGAVGLAGGLLAGSGGRQAGQLTLAESEKRSLHANQLGWDALGDYQRRMANLSALSSRQGYNVLGDYQRGLSTLDSTYRANTGQIRNLYEQNTAGAMGIAGEGRSVEGLYEGAYDQARKSVRDESSRAGANILAAYQGGRSRTGARLSSSAMEAAGLDAIRAREAGMALGQLDIGEAQARAGARESDINRRLGTYLGRAGVTEQMLGERRAGREALTERGLTTSLGYQDTILGRRLALEQQAAQGTFDRRFDPTMLYPFDNYAANIPNPGRYQSTQETLGQSLQGVGGYMFGRSLEGMYR